MITRSNLPEYVQWDERNQRYDITFKTLWEQTEPDVKTLMMVVFKSWFFPEVMEAVKKWIEGEGNMDTRQLSLF